MISTIYNENGAKFERDRDKDFKLYKEKENNQELNGSWCSEIQEMEFSLKKILI